MKKYFPILASLLLCACSDDSSLMQDNIPSSADGIVFNVPDFVEEDGSRTNITIDNTGAKFTWREGDVLGVFPTTGYQTAFPISNGAGSASAIYLFLMNGQ